MSSGSEELEVSLETLQMTPVQNANSHLRTNKLSSCPVSPTGCCEPTSEVGAIQPTDIVFDASHDNTPPAEWTSEQSRHALTFNESTHLRHQMSCRVINPTNGDDIVQWNKSTPKSQTHATTRVACVPKSCSKGTSKTTENINQTPRAKDAKSDVIVSIIRVGTKNTPPSAGDARECEVTSQDAVPRQSSTCRGRGGRKEGTTNKPKTIGQGGNHRQAVYAFVEAFPPAARALNIQALGRSEKCWRELEAAVRCYRLKEERLIMRMLRLERLQNLTVEAERRRSNAAFAFKQPKSNGVLEAPIRQGSDQPGADRRTRSNVAWSRPASAYSCRDADQRRRETLIDAGDSRGASDSHTRCSELNTGRSLRSSSTKPSGRYAWL